MVPTLPHESPKITSWEESKKGRSEARERMEGKKGKGAPSTENMRLRKKFKVLIGSKPSTRHHRKKQSTCASRVASAGEWDQRRAGRRSRRTRTSKTCQFNGRRRNTTRVCTERRDLATSVSDGDWGSGPRAKTHENSCWGD